MNLETFQAFSKEASLATQFTRAGERLGRGVVSTVAETGGILRHSMDPTKLKQGLREGMHGMSNQAARKREALAETIKSKGSDYVADFHHGNGIGSQLRRSGWLSNTPKYTGQSTSKKVTNTIARALPGEKAVVTPLLAHSAYSMANEKNDPATGRPVGTAERGLRAGLGLTTGIVGMRTGRALPAIGSALVGDYVGKRVGRTIDRGVSNIRSRRSA